MIQSSTQVVIGYERLSLSPCHQKHSSWPKEEAIFLGVKGQVNFGNGPEGLIISEGLSIVTGDMFNLNCVVYTGQ